MRQQLRCFVKTARRLSAPNEPNAAQNRSKNVPQETEQQERERLAKLPFLTKIQRQSLLDPGFSLRLCRVLVSALRAQSAAEFEAKPEGEKALARGFGRTEHVAIDNAINDGPRTIFGGTREVARG